MSLLLTDKERERFAAYLNFQADTYKGLIKEMEKMPGPVITEIIKREKFKIAAYLVVASDLSNSEGWDIER